MMGDNSMAFKVDDSPEKKRAAIEVGARRVEDLITSLEYGMFS